MPLIHILLALSVALSWGFNYIGFDFELKTFPPFFLAFLRMFLATFPIIFFVKKPKIDQSKLFGFGFFMFFLQFGLLLLGLYFKIPGSIAGVLIQSQALFTTLFAAVIFKEKIKKLQYLGIFVSLLGIGLILNFSIASFSIAGILACLGAGLSWAIGNGFARKLEGPPLSIVVYGSLYSLPPLLIVSFFVEGSNRILSALSSMSLSDFFILLYLSYVTILLAYVVWTYLIEKNSLSLVSPFALLTPVVAIFSTAIFNQVPIKSWEIISCVMIILGLFIDIMAKKKSSA